MAPLCESLSLWLGLRSGSTNYTVGVDLKTDGGRTRVVLTFPHHTTLYYDPTASFQSDGSIASTSTTTTGTSSATTTAARNGAAGKRASAWGLVMGAAGAALLVLV
jgi:hypothetical protein